MKNTLSVFFVERASGPPDWVIYMLVGTLALIVLGKLIFSNNFLSLSSFEKFLTVNENQNFFRIIFQIAYAVLLSMLLVNYLTDDFSYLLHTPLIKLLAFSLLILLFFWGRGLLSEIGAYAFGLNLDKDFRLKVFNYYRVFAVVALWIAVLLFYFTKVDKPFLLIFLGAILLIMRLMSLFLILKNKPAEESRFWYYNISYLCTLEILPVLVLLKLVVTW